jgi:hypothetical protein
MADETITNPMEGFPPPNIPVVFADSITGLYGTSDVVRFYLSRHDANYLGTQSKGNTPHVQVAMPLSGFIQFFAYAEYMMNVLMHGDPKMTNRLEELREQFAKIRANHDAKKTNG